MISSHTITLKIWLFAFISIFFLSCNTPTVEQKSPDKTIVKTNKTPPKAEEKPDFALNYIKSKLYPNKWDNLQASKKKFDAAVVDLNDDGKPETIFSVLNADYCGSGGCTLFLLDHAGKFMGKVAVMDFPVGISKNKTGAWRDLFVKSKQQDVVLQFGEGEYTTNASLAKKVTPSERKQLVTKEVLTKYAR